MIHLDESLSDQWIAAGRLFDEVVHRGVDPNALLAREAGHGRWEVVALPRSATPP
jgi:hypothetical protein